jgi:TonB family protein
MLFSLFTPSRRQWWQRPLVAALLLCAAAPALAAARTVEKRVPPEYPVLALRMRISGVVTVSATVAADGRVTAAKAEHGNSLLAPAAVAAVRKWKFAPAAAASTETVDVTFDMGS